MAQKDLAHQQAANARWNSNAPDRASKALHEWVDHWAPRLGEFAPHEIAVVGSIAAAIDARIAERQRIVSMLYAGDKAAGQ